VVHLIPDNLGICWSGQVNEHLVINKHAIEFLYLPGRSLQFSTNDMVNTDPMHAVTKEAPI